VLPLVFKGFSWLNEFERARRVITDSGQRALPPVDLLPDHRSPYNPTCRGCLTRLAAKFSFWDNV
jgi:hypothetical protein